METAIRQLDLSERRFLELGKTKLAASTQVSKLIALAMLGRYDEAIECGLRSLEIFKAESDLLAIGKVEHNIGNIYFRRDRYKEAEEFQRSARAHFESANDVIQLAKIENSLALTLSQQHLTKAAEQLYEQALKRAELAGLKSTQAEIESSIGTLALFQGYYDRALDYLERSRRKYAELNLPHVLALTEQEIADAYLELNLAPEAIEIYDRVEKRFAKLGMHADQARAMAYHGRAEIGLGNFARAQSLLASAREVYMREGNEVGAALVELTEAQLFYAKGDYISTEAAAHHAELVLISAGNSRRVVFARWLQGEAARSDRRWDQAQDLLNSTLIAAKQAAQPDIVARCLTSLGLLAAESGEALVGEQEFLRAVEIIEKLRGPLPAEEFRTAFFSDKLVPYRELARIMLDGGPEQLTKAFRYIEQARSRSLVDVLGGSMTVELSPQDEFDESLLESLEEKRHELSYFYNQLNQFIPPTMSRSPEQVTELQGEVRKREAAVSELTRQLRHSKKERGGLSEELDFDRLQKSLGSDKALVEFTSIDDELFAFVVTDKCIDVIRDLGSESKIGEEVTKFRFQVDSLRFGSAAIRKHLPVLTVRVQQHLQMLYDKLIGPIQQISSGRDLVIVPTGRLHYLPFHALHDGERYLIESRAVSYAPSATVLQQCLMREEIPLNRALLMGVADERTLQVNDEIEKLQHLFSKPIVFMNEQATLAGLRENSANADVIHLACHAQFRADNPQFSSLQLGDGWLTVNEAYSLRLHCRLVTLSACETGLNTVSPGEELIGLARGFLSAGSPSVLLSLWTVDDEATNNLMVNFYSELIRLRSPAKALQNAQVELLRSQPHPFFWSPFVLVGRW
jgi:tetratricopeptide (TPR) repeat protein